MKKYWVSFFFLVINVAWSIQAEARGAVWTGGPQVLRDIQLKNPFSDLPLVNNAWVQQWIDFFQYRDSHRFQAWLEMSYRYLPLMRAIFEQEGLPRDLMYISMIESGFSPHAVSRAGAVGYWQFIPATSKRFGLKTTHWLDERKDFEKSTWAASQYLKLLHKKFGNWLLAISAYNMGEARLSQLIKKYQTQDFWQLARKKGFPYETAHYVPQLLAAVTIAKAPAMYGFKYLRAKLPYDYEIFYLPGGTNLKALALSLHQPYKKIQALNPSLLRSRLPRHLKNWSVRIPAKTGYEASLFIQNSPNL